MWDLGLFKTFPNKKFALLSPGYLQPQSSYRVPTHTIYPSISTCKYYIDRMYTLYLHCNLWPIV